MQIARVTSACVLLAMLAGQARAAEADQGPNSFISTKFQGACDSQNNRLWLTNAHTFKTIAVTLRWKAAGGKDLVEQFFLAPNTTKEIGCAAEAAIADAMFADF
jgi:hypothetical protein